MSRAENLSSYEKSTIISDHSLHSKQSCKCVQMEQADDTEIIVKQNTGDVHNTVISSHYVLNVYRRFQRLFISRQIPVAVCENIRRFLFYSFIHGSMSILWFWMWKLKMKFFLPHLKPMPSIKSCIRSFDIICMFELLNIVKCTGKSTNLQTHTWKHTWTWVWPLDEWTVIPQ